MKRKIIPADELQAVIDWYRIARPYPRKEVIARFQSLIEDRRKSNRRQMFNYNVPACLERRKSYRDRRNYR